MPGMNDNNPDTNFKVIDKRSPETQARAAEMPEAKHTPGPWKASHNPGWDWAGVIANGECIATTHTPYGKDTSVLLADTYLIAAAPDLLEACQYTFDRLSDRPLTCRTDQERLEELEEWIVDEILPMLESAIAKAKGE